MSTLRIHYHSLHTIFVHGFRWSELEQNQVSANANMCYFRISIKCPSIFKNSDTTQIHTKERNICLHSIGYGEGIHQCYLEKDILQVSFDSFILVLL